MEEPSNGKIEGTRKDETLEEEEEEEQAEGITKEVEKLKIQAENPEEIVHDENDLIPENSISIEEKVEEDKKGILEEVEKEAVEPSLESSEANEVIMQNSDSVEGVKKEVEEKSLVTLEGIGAAEHGKISSLEVKDGLPEEVIVSRDVAEEVAVGEEKDGQASGIVVENSVEEIVQQSTKVDVVGSSDAIPENAGNTPIISLSQRAGQPTSWRSCCGLLEVLRRSNR